jgi:hypothetical protein
MLRAAFAIRTPMGASPKRPMLRQNRSRILPTALCLWSMLFLAPPSSLHASENTKTVMAEDGRYIVSLTGPGEPWYDPKLGGRVKFTFSVIDKIDSRQYPVYLDNMTAKINRIAIYHDKLIVIGEETSLHSVITSLIDLSQREEVDTFVGFDTKLSGTGRFLSFRKFYPPDTSEPEAMSDLVLIYDMDGSPDSNRMRGIDAYKNDPIGRLTEVGNPVFPENFAGRKNYRVWVRDENRRNSVIPDGFFWLGDDQKFGFLDRIGGNYLLIVVDISNGPSHSVIHTHEIDPLSLIGPEENGKPDVIHAVEPLRLEAIEKLADDRIRIRLAAGIPLKNNQIEFSAEESAPAAHVQSNEPVKGSQK